MVFYFLKENDKKIKENSIEFYKKKKKKSSNLYLLNST
jgi:hypothetical protein